MNGPPKTPSLSVTRLDKLGLGELGLGELGLGEMGLGEMGGHQLIVYIINEEQNDGSLLLQRRHLTCTI